MPAEDWPEGTGRVVLDTVDSTLDEARRRGGPGPTWILARMQTAARGRRGRPWRMAPGNFAATLILPVPEGPAAMPRRSFVAALALHDALHGVAGPMGLSLKWPNDVLLSGGKLAGILLEGLDAGRLAVGIGANLAAAPDASEVEPGARRPVALPEPVPPEVLLDRLAPAFAAWEGTLRRDGFGPIRAAWIARAEGVGQPIRARTGGEDVQGAFEGIDAEGHLILSTAAGRRHLPAADIAP